ncbi:hypothetical protein B5X24_HaOG210368 [Helicoverpa armigera]|uniref:Uncharacterized protein n=1 Tax=Helicoverpa armigera TaxID=29058 RepID=A0A2W1BF40_HELAM|nr:hypothetical protein B5X24_HaOG210368 [Helicoverpa armigera]
MLPGCCAAAQALHAVRSADGQYLVWHTVTYTRECVTAVSWPKRFCAGAADCSTSAALPVLLVAARALLCRCSWSRHKRCCTGAADCGTSAAVLVLLLVLLAYAFRIV